MALKKLIFKYYFNIITTHLCLTYFGDHTLENTEKTADNADNVLAKWDSFASMIYCCAENASGNMLTPLASTSINDLIC